jgi:hypothetical protein
MVRRKGFLRYYFALGTGERECANLVDTLAITITDHILVRGILYEQQHSTGNINL